MDKEQMLKAQMVNVQQNITTQINIGVVKGNYFQHVENVNISAPRTDEEPPAPGRKRQNAVEALFGDEQRRTREAKRFNAFLQAQGIGERTLNSAQKHPVNRVFVAWYRYWAEQEELPEQPNGDACYRFLCEDCGFEFSVGQKTYANFIRKTIDEIPDSDLGDLPELLRRSM